MKPLFVIVLATFNLLACAQHKANTTMEQHTTNGEAPVMAIVRKLADLMIARDTTAMNTILDDQYTLTHLTGYVQTKAEWFAEVERESMKYYSAKELNHAVKITGNRADVTVQNLVDARIWGSRNTWRLQQKMQLEKREGRWVILKSVASTF